MVHSGGRERLDEELLTSRGSSGELIQHFQFTLRWEVGSLSGMNDFNLFPKQFMQAMEAFNVQALKLSFSKGTWNEKAWGKHLDPSPSGVELWAILGAQSQPDSGWKRLTRSLAGMSCASLEVLDKENLTVHPETLQGRNWPGYTTHYGQMSTEASCTENLTPWIKLLPCRDIHGLASLIDPVQVFSAQFHSFSIHFQRVCSDSSVKSCNAIELTLSLSVVHTKTTWLSLELKDTCPLSATARVLTVVPADTPGAKQLGGCGSAPFFVEVDAKTSLDKVQLLPPELQEVVSSGVSTRRFSTGSGRVSGGTHTTILSESNEEQRVEWMEIVPAYLKVEPTSLELRINDDLIPTDVLWRRSSVSYGSQAPLLFQTNFTLPAKGVATFRLGFRQAFLPLEAFPPDPNRGFDIPSSVLSFSRHSTCPRVEFKSPLLSRYSTRFLGDARGVIYPGSLVVAMPLPDFSMPYNVITLSSTVLAFFVGSMLNVAVRPPKVTKEELDDAQKSRRKRLQGLKNLFFICLLALAWLFENDRDTFDRLVAQFF